MAFAAFWPMTIATLDLWTDPVDALDCRIVIYADACDLEMYSHGHRRLTQRFESVPEALIKAGQLRRNLVGAEPQAA